MNFGRIRWGTKSGVKRGSSYRMPLCVAGAKGFAASGLKLDANIVISPIEVLDHSRSYSMVLSRDLHQPLSMYMAYMMTVLGAKV